MSLREARGRIRANERKVCKLGQIKAVLTPEDLEYLADLEENDTATEIARTLRADRYEVSDTTVKTHYRGDCACVTP